MIICTDTFVGNEKTGIDNWNLVRTTAKGTAWESLLDFSP